VKAAWKGKSFMSPQATVPPPVFPADVAAFAAECGVTDYLTPVYEMTRLVFPMARRIAPVLEYDPEIDGLRCIVFRVEVGVLDVERFADVHWGWDRELFKTCPAPLVCNFGLHVDMRGA
jgi:hypothetical protein